jgi:hypothetical protein
MPPVLPSFARRRRERRMRDDRRDQDSGSRLDLVMRDVQFWVPVAVLVGGLIVLRWIS